MEAIRFGDYLLAHLEQFQTELKDYGTDPPLRANAAKTAKRSIPLLDEAMPVLKRRHLEQGMPREGWVFPSDAKSGHILNISKAFREARKAAGLPNNLVLYASRHGMMTDLASVLPLDAVMRIGGHTDAKVALGYQHTEVTDLQARLTEARTKGRIN
jgi:hypothetical protein